MLYSISGPKLPRLDQKFKARLGYRSEQLTSNQNKLFKKPELRVVHLQVHCIQQLLATPAHFNGANAPNENKYRLQSNI